MVVSFSADLERRVCSDDSGDPMRVSDERHSWRRKFTTSKFRQNNRRGRFYCRVECSGLYDVCRSASAQPFTCGGPSIERSMSRHIVLYIRAILEVIYLKKCQTRTDENMLACVLNAPDICIQKSSKHVFFFVLYCWALRRLYIFQYWLFNPIP